MKLLCNSPAYWIILDRRLNQHTSTDCCQPWPGRMHYPKGPVQNAGWPREKVWGQNRDRKEGLRPNRASGRSTCSCVNELGANLARLPYEIIRDSTSFFASSKLWDLQPYRKDVSLLGDHLMIDGTDFGHGTLHTADLCVLAYSPTCALHDRFFFFGCGCHFS